MAKQSKKAPAAVKQPVSPAQAIAALSTAAPEPAPQLGMIRYQFVASAATWNPLSWSSPAIAWWGGGWRGYSHVDLLLPDGSLLGARSDAIGGKPPGVQIRPGEPNPYEKWIRRSIVVFIRPQAEVDAWEALARSKIGDAYSKKDIEDLIFGKQPIRPDSGSWICSMFGAWTAVERKLMDDPGCPVGQVIPDTLHACLCSAGGAAAYYGPNGELQDAMGNTVEISRPAQAA